MSKGRIGLSGSDRAHNQLERDLRDMKRNGEYDSRKSAPVSYAEQVEHNKFMQTWEGRFPGYGLWESELKEQLSKINCGYGLLAECEIYPRTFKADGYEKRIEPKEFARMLKAQTGF